MVYPHEHLLLRFNGHFGSSASAFVDRWSAGLRIGLPGSAPVYDSGKLQTLVNACHAAAQTLHASVSTYAGTACYYDYTSGANIGVLGNYVPTTQLTVISPTNSTNGTGAGGPGPWSQAQVVSLRTANPRGRASNGRFYWPATAATVDASTGRVTTAQTNSRLTQFKTFMDAVNTAANAYYAGAKIVVASAVGGGAIAYVTAIRSDNRLDAIERRENDQPAVWSTQNLA